MSKVKAKCCRSTPLRCKSCPVVAARLAKLHARGVTGKRLKRELKAARAT